MEIVETEDAQETDEGNLNIHIMEEIVLHKVMLFLI